MKRLLILLTCICSISAYSQQAIDFNDYIPLKCQGPIPQDFKDELSQLVKITNEANIDKDINEKALESSFAELSNYQLNNILYSGNILYGDTLTSYINKVADVILKDDPALRSKLRFYVLKNTELNAYTTQKGIIFVSLGLLSRINNESQLAFILCHEIIHYRNNHNIESYKNTSRILNPDYKTNLSVKEKLHEIFTYSKAHESEADREGLLLFLKSPYSTDSLNNLFDVMLHSYLPFNEIPFSLFYFDSNIRHTFPKQYFLDSISGISSTKEDAADSMSSHPNIKSRRQSIDSLLRIHGKNTGALYVYPQSQFEYIQKTARYETTILHLENTELAAAFYNSYLIEKTYGKSKFSDKIIGSALYGLSKHKNYYDEAKYNDVLLDWTKTEGQQQGVYYFFNKIPAKELNILAASKLYTLYLSYNDSFFLDRFRSSMRDLILDYDIKVDFFKNDSMIL